MTESEIQKQIMDYSELRGWKVFRMNSGYSGRHNLKLCPPGTPDLLIVMPNRYLWVEVKTGTGTLRDTQVKMIKELEDLGHMVIVVRSLDWLIANI